MKKIYFVLLLLISSQTINSQKLGLILKGSTTGLGGDIGYRINPRLLIKAGIDQFNYNLKTSFEDGSTNFDLNGQIGAGTIGISADYQLLNKVYVTGGLVLNQFKTDFKGKLLNDIEFGDLIIKKENVGQINWKVKPKSTIAPYLGIGIGNLLNLNKKLNFGFEVGAMLQGPPSFEIIGDGFFSANSSPEFDQAGKLNTTFSSFQFYPVIRLNLAYALKTF
jgi:opacity protein-like surface antigen